MSVQEAVLDFLRAEMLIAPEEQLGLDDPLMGSGILDSFGTMALIDHLERTFSIKIPRNQLTKTDFDSLRAIEVFCKKTMGLGA